MYTQNEPHDMCFHRDTRVTLASDMVTHYGSWVMFSLESFTLSLTGNYKWWALPKLCKYYNCKVFFDYLLRIVNIIKCEHESK